MMSDNHFTTAFLIDQFWSKSFPMSFLTFAFCFSFICGLICALVVYKCERKRNKLWFSYASMSFLVGMVSIQFFMIYYAVIELLHTVIEEANKDVDHKVESIGEAFKILRKGKN